MPALQLVWFFLTADRRQRRKARKDARPEGHGGGRPVPEAQGEAPHAVRSRQGVLLRLRLAPRACADSDFSPCWTAAKPTAAVCGPGRDTGAGTPCSPAGGSRRLPLQAPFAATASRSGRRPVLSPSAPARASRLRCGLSAAP